MRRHISSRAHLATACAIVIGAMAWAATASAGELPKYSELPSGHVTMMPSAKQKPTTVGAHEQVPGFFVAVPGFPPQVPARARYVSVVGDAATATQIRRGEGVDTAARDLGACFTNDSVDSDDEEGDAAAPQEWSAGQGWEVNVWPKSKDNTNAGVTAVHRERLVKDRGAISLESIDAWVDPTTRGARLIARATLPLVRVGTALGGVEVYAGREERPGGARLVQYVVVRAPTTRASRVGSMTAMRQDGNNAHDSGCGHLRMPLGVQSNDGDTAVVMVPTELPAAPKAKGSDGAHADDDDRDARADQPPAAAPLPVPGKVSAKSRRFRRKGQPPAPPPPPVAAAAAAEHGDALDARKEPVERELRTRDMQVHIGVSQTSRDAQPLLALSFGWASREQVQRVFDEPTPPSPDHATE